MKILALFIVLAVGRLPAFCQDSLARMDFLEKSRKQKTAALVFTGIGTGLIIAGTIVATSHSYDPVEY